MYGIEWEPLPQEVRALPRLCLNKYAPLHRRGEQKHFVSKEGVRVAFVGNDRTLFEIKKMPEGCVFVWRLAALVSCGYPLNVAGLLAVLFLMWIDRDRPSYLSPIEGGYGYIDFRPDDCISYFGGEKWSRVKKLICKLQDLLKLEKLKDGKWRVIFLLERCDRMLYDDSEETRRFGANLKYLELLELDMKKKTIQYYENKRKAEQASKDSGGEKKAEQASKDSGGGDVFDGIDFGC